MALSWRRTHQLGILGAILVLVGLAVFLFILPTLTKKATCSDGVQNGTETGIDCGGSCTRYCVGALPDPQILWRRAFRVTPTVYNAVAYIENQNTGAGVYKIAYEFRLYDEHNVFIAQRDGSTYIGREGKSAILETGIDVGTKTPKRTEFTFTSRPVWSHLTPTDTPVPVRSKDFELLDTDTRPKLRATVYSVVYDTLPSVDLIAILYGGDGNAVQVSKTVEDFTGMESKEVFFTWPQPFSDTPVRFEIVPRLNPFVTK
jgi:hypothetical protein